MKNIFRISGVILLFLSIFLIQTTGQEKGSKLFTIDVGGKSIVIASPENDLAEVGDTIRKEYELQVPKNLILKAVLLPNDAIKNFRTDKPISSGELVILIEVGKEIENVDCLEQDFVDFKNSFKSKLPKDLPEYSKDANLIASKLKDAIRKQELGTPVILGTALDIKDAFADLIFTTKDNGLNKVLIGGLFIRLKNKILCIYIDNFKVNEESLAWISNTIQTWSKSLFELNRDLSPVIKSNSSKSGQETSSSNNTGQNKNLFEEVIYIFRELLIQTPITFVCLSIIIILYYAGTRKLFSGYLNSKTNQSSEYLYIKNFHSGNSNNIKYLRLFLRLVEFSVVLIIFLSLLRIIGLPFPSGFF